MFMGGEVLETTDEGHSLHHAMISVPGLAARDFVFTIAQGMADEHTFFVKVASVEDQREDWGEWLRGDAQSRLGWVRGKLLMTGYLATDLGDGTCELTYLV